MSAVFAIGDLPVAFRPARAEDESIVVAPWLQGHRHGGDWPRLVSAWRYFGQQKLVIARILARARTVVACDARRPSFVLGFVCFEPANVRPAVLHWVFTKRNYGRQGLGRRLLEETGAPKFPIWCSHWTRSAEGLVSRGWGLIYRPFLLEDDLEATKDQVHRPLRGGDGGAGAGPHADADQRALRSGADAGRARGDGDAEGWGDAVRGGDDGGAVVAGARAGAAGFDERYR